MGKAKMLLPYGEQTILGHIVEEVTALNPAIICLVTGKYTTEIEAVINVKTLEMVPFANWQAGMSASIQFGLTALLEKEPNIDAVLFVVSDQPFLDRQLLFRMIDAFQQSGKGIVAAQYQQQFGTPVLFSNHYIPEIKLLEGDRGAKKLVAKQIEDVVLVDFPLGALDIDTAEDYAKFQELLNQQDAH
ncbi:MAG: CTP:molybdopterin cytidylyltransferase [Chitinophagaceae bacterium BSSC1]|nr:MAG: CTP:molybdopterin cytidylyltransferase [Chitinophagaceae bacterium BSSC1]